MDKRNRTWGDMTMVAALLGLFVLLATWAAGCAAEFGRFFPAVPGFGR
jgi:hypothetical protein